MFHIVLVAPQIPPNTGNVIRLCANVGASLHLVRPLGFDIDDASLRRAGLDYHEFVTMRVHDDLAQCRAAIGDGPSWYGLSRHGRRTYTDVAYARRCPGVRFGGVGVHAGGACGVRRATHLAADAAGQPQPQPLQQRGGGGLRSVETERLRRSPGLKRWSGCGGQKFSINEDGSATRSRTSAGRSPDATSAMVVWSTIARRLQRRAIHTSRRGAAAPG